MPTITGTSSPDTLTGSTGDDTITGLDGADQIDGREGIDTIYGGEGDDAILSGYTSTAVLMTTNIGTPQNPVAVSYFVINDPAGNFVYGEGGNDRLFGGANDLLDGGTGDDIINANRLAASLFPPAVTASVTLIGGDGNDSISTSGYVASIDGGAGDDQINIRGGTTQTPTEAATIITGSGSDLVLIDYPYPSFPPSSAITISDFTAGAGGDVLIFSGTDLGSQPSPIGSWYVGQTLRFAQDGADTVVIDLFTATALVRLTGVNASALTSANLASLQRAGASGTLTRVDPGPIYQLGAESNDLYSGTAAADFYDGRAGDDIAIGGAGDDRLFGQFGSDVLIGGAGNDYLHGGYGAGADVLNGGVGADVLVSDGDADILTGGSGADVFTFGYVTQVSPARAVTITDFDTGVDRIDVLASPNAASDLVLIREGNTTLIFAAFGPNQFPSLYLTIAGEVVLSDFLLRGTPQVTLVGDSQANTLTGTTRGDGLLGEGGADVLIGGGGGDALGGGAGADVFRYLATTDSTSAGADNLFDFETGIDTVDLTALNATSISVIRGADGSSFIFAETPAGGFMATAAGRAVGGGDFTYGGTFGVYLVGSGASETLIGSGRADPISGGAGNDTIIGGGGADVLFGDGGADTFVYRAASESTTAAADTVFGFVSGLDRIDLSSVRTGATDTFGIAYLSGGSFLFVDLGGNGSNDMLIQLANTTLRTSDVLWSTSAVGVEPAVKDAGPDVLPLSDDADAAWTGLVSAYDEGMLFLADGGLASARGHDWYL